MSFCPTSLNSFPIAALPQSVTIAKSEGINCVSNNGTPLSSFIYDVSGNPYQTLNGQTYTAQYQVCANSEQEALSKVKSMPVPNFHLKQSTSGPTVNWCNYQVPNLDPYWSPWVNVPVAKTCNSTHPCPSELTCQQGVCVPPN
jgi:hypothetical protein